jgi:hypothetical protein
MNAPLNLPRSNSVLADSCQEAIDRFIVASGMTKNRIGQKLGHSGNFVYRIYEVDMISRHTEKKVFLFIYKRWPAGAPMPAIIRDYARREFPNDLGRRPPARKVKKRRPCMSCRKPFDSEGNHNRICPSCKTSAASRLGAEFL